MESAMKVIFLALVGFVSFSEATKVVCYYNSTAVFREGHEKFETHNLEIALHLCTHLVYGYAAIDPNTHEMIPQNEAFDVSHNHYKHITDLRRLFPHLKVMLSVDASNELQDSNNNVLSTEESRMAFVNSAKEMMKEHDFDGLDLSWQFPEQEKVQPTERPGSYMDRIKHRWSGDNLNKELTSVLKENFTNLVGELKKAFRPSHLQLSLSVLPGVNSSAYYSPQDLADNLDFVNLMAFDYHTPSKCPDHADYPAPLYQPPGRNIVENVNAEVNYWVNRYFPRNKIVIGIPTFGRVWRMKSSAREVDGVPPLSVDGSASINEHTEEPGFMTYLEICHHLSSTQSGRQHEWTLMDSESSQNYGPYAYRKPDANGEHGIWIGYENRASAQNKAIYVKNNHLGGVAIVDITMDDFHGDCSAAKYPILRGAALLP